jgi:predicted DNA-binding transcriptional regulator AlpA
MDKITKYAEELKAMQAIVTAGGEVLVNRRIVQLQLGGISTATFYRIMADGTFPRPIAVTEGRRAWPLSTVQDWIKQRIAGK